jgi:hypothetical protein
VATITTTTATPTKCCTLMIKTNSITTITIITSVHRQPVEMTTQSHLPNHLIFLSIYFFLFSTLSGRPPWPPISSPFSSYISRRTWLIKASTKYHYNGWAAKRKLSSINYINTIKHLIDLCCFFFKKKKQVSIWTKLTLQSGNTKRPTRFAQSFSYVLATCCLPFTNNFKFLSFVFIFFSYSVVARQV